MRIAIVGNSGSGKSTLARSIHTRTGWPHVEIDALFHLADWQPQDPSVFQASLRDALCGPDWICDGNYSALADDIVRGTADVIMVFDLARRTVMRQLISRTIRRFVRREVLWNGNREPLSNFYRWDPNKNILRWAWVRHEPARAEFQHAIDSGRWAHARVVHIQSHADGERFVATLPTS